ncbi:hypothetical protein DUZ99_16480 [Xylanibacillus composti]|uniref:Central glycolytic genes regulator n=1 Tax=Xylanibacillus composti TaxID=1572762 RepID=A0A8J4H4Z5_9BACL|nr:sugar-binding domain-containing protein [Xylanibacillus composti]MDT9726577.1 hypothetical protein [Xylanibacillus composti]GIQ68994.1 central glycolytic genes regulator [Xylanibacillus composti]
MSSLLELQKQLLPELMDVMKKRYTILHHIKLSGSIGRRTLAQSVHMTERVLRSEVDILKQQGLLDTNSTGMHITAAGEELLEGLEPYIRQLFGLTDLAERIRCHFGLKQVIIVPGDSDESILAKKELGRAGAAALREVVQPQDVIAVAGGSTMAEIAECLTASSAFRGTWFLPARGGLGENVELQANSIASTMAKRTGGQYRLLHVPDHLSEDAYQSLIQEPNIRELIAIIRKARIVVHGIGDAMVMATRRNVDSAMKESLAREGALAEAFGYYFDHKGHVVHNIPTVGLRLEDIYKTELVIGVAGGKSKGEAIAAVLRFGHEDILVTDEAAAEQILHYLS